MPALIRKNDVLHLQYSSSDTVFIDFASKANTFRRKHGGGLGQAIAKAIGITPKTNLTVLDTTAGLGKDAFVLASLGCTVTLIEKSPEIFALLEDGIKRAKQDPEIASIIARMKLIHADSIQYLQKSSQPFDVIYLDPMFPAKQKSALPKKDMQALQKWLNHDEPDSELLKTALKHAKKRVVVKRPRLAPPLNNHKPDFSYNGKSCRFDVYFGNA
ncbi:MAG: class I SAM-dependent methyltransferase [Gammaproteobacteria bacterium]|nr:class I SAM-dependent methyltransferase [Gammaproteobacteria bacterium]MBU1629356.1 class I SAM-dependent methyltransferase [Gammaproteobacteria bacterium]MBU1926739.1 class I SAM-dependent methyltransferase [Gammaproteobacteria bacterium]